jgi:hypothetical protein
MLKGRALAFASASVIGLVVVLLVTLNLLSRRRDQKNITQPTETVEPNPISLRDLIGTLDIQADSVPQNPDDGSERKGWLFIDGNLQGLMPIRKNLKLIPNKYEVRTFIAQDSSDSIKFWTVSWNTDVNRGNTVTMVTSRTIDPWMARATERSDVKYYYKKIERVSNPTLTIDSSAEQTLQEINSRLNKKWEAFVQTAEWKAIAEALQRLEHAPPTRRRVWIDMPYDLGGPREIDVEQLRVIESWFVHSATSDQEGWTEFETSTSQDVDGYTASDINTNARKLSETVQARVKWIKDIFNFIAKSIENAPEER